MEYYKDENGKIYADPISKKGLTLAESPIKEDGSLLPNHKHLKSLATKEDGTYYDKYTLEKTPIFLNQQELDVTTLQQAKDKKISEIDAQTGKDIEALVGDNNKQKDLLAEANRLTRKENKGIATVEDIATLDALEALNEQVGNLKYSGNNREAIVSLIEITSTLENALIEIEGI